MATIIWRRSRGIGGCGHVELVEIQPDPLKVLLVLKAVNLVLADDPGDVRERIVGAVDGRRGSLPTQDRLVAFRASVVLAVLFANEICKRVDEKVS